MLHQSRPGKESITIPLPNSLNASRRIVCWEPLAHSSRHTSHTQLRRVLLYDIEQDPLHTLDSQSSRLQANITDGSRPPPIIPTSDNQIPCNGLRGNGPHHPQRCLCNACKQNTPTWCPTISKPLGTLVFRYCAFHIFLYLTPSSTKNWKTAAPNAATMMLRLSSSTTNLP